MSAPSRWRQLTLFDDLEVPIAVSVEAPQPSLTDGNQVDRVPAIDVNRVRRRRPTNQQELDGLH